MSRPALIALAALLAGGILFVVFRRPAPPPAETTATAPRSTNEEMAALLAERAALVDPTRLELLVNDRRADLLAAAVQGMRPTAARLDKQYHLARELMNAGRLDEAAAAVKTLQEDT